MGQRIALVSAPWQLADRPSLALGVLKGHLRRHGHDVAAVHLHLQIATDIGMDLYRRISTDLALGETLYSCLEAPEQRDELLRRAVDGSQRAGRGALSAPVLEGLLATLAERSERAVDRFRLPTYCAVGFSVSHVQLMSSLHLARLLKRSNPACIVVFGGRSLIGGASEALLARAPEVDLVVQGEGEEALLALAGIEDLRDFSALRRIPNLCFRSPTGIEKTPPAPPRNLGDGVAPDYAEYFELARALGHASHALSLPVEASRGCAWENRDGADRPRACAFCALNRNWQGYREKPMDDVLAEIRAGIAGHRVLNISFADSCLPESYRKPLLRALIALRMDLRIFCELRAGDDEETIALLARAGVRRVQVGVESFSSGLLRRIGKGTTAMQNIETMKFCLEWGIECQCNVLTYVPGATPEEIGEMLRLAPKLHGLRPPDPVPMFLARNSPMHRNPAAYGIVLDSVNCPADHYLSARLADPELIEHIRHRCSGGELEEHWAKLNDAVGAWRKSWDSCAQRGITLPLSYRDAGDYLLISDYRSERPVSYTLASPLRQICLAARASVSISALASQFPGVRSSQLEAAIGKLEDEALMVRDRDQVLFLPAHECRLVPDPEYSCAAAWQTAQQPL